MTADLLGDTAPPEQQHVPVAVVVSPSELAASWDEHEALYRRALEYSWQASDTAENVAKALAQGTAWAIDVVMGDDLLASAVVERIETKKGPVLNIWCCAGDAMDQWLGDILEAIENWALVVQADSVMLSGRQGWQRELKEYGYKTSNITLVKELSNVSRW